MKCNEAVFLEGTQRKGTSQRCHLWNGNTNLFCMVNTYMVYETIIFLPVHIFSVHNCLTVIINPKVAISNMSNDKSYTTEHCAIFNVSL